MFSEGIKLQPNETPTYLGRGEEGPAGVKPPVPNHWENLDEEDPAGPG